MHLSLDPSQLGMYLIPHHSCEQWCSYGKVYAVGEERAGVIVTGFAMTSRLVGTRFLYAKLHERYSPINNIIS